MLKFASECGSYINVEVCIRIHRWVWELRLCWSLQVSVGVTSMLKFASEYGSYVYVEVCIRIHMWAWGVSSMLKFASEYVGGYVNVEVCVEVCIEVCKWVCGSYINVEVCIRNRIGAKRNEWIRVWKPTRTKFLMLIQKWVSQKKNWFRFSRKRICRSASIKSVQHKLKP